MQTFVSRAFVPTVAATLAGCAIVSSERLPPAGDGGQGVVYALPMARVPVVLAANAGQIILRLEAPLVVADPDHTYTARRVGNPFSADQVTIVVDPATGFLASVSAIGKDETLTVLETLLAPAKGAQPEAMDAPGEEIYRAELNPADPQELAQETAALNQALAAFLTTQANRCGQAAQVCAEYAAVRQQEPKIELTGRRAARLAAAGHPAGTADTAPADCRSGVCYRQPLPFVLKATLGASVRSVIVNIPNASPVIVVPLERHAFVSTTHTLAFEQGSLKSATVDRPSSALALVSSPLAAVSGIIGSITKPLSELLKIDTSGQYQAEADTAQAKADEAQAKADEASAGAPRADAGTPPKLLATLTLGRSHPTAGLDTAGPGAVPAAAPGPALSSPGASGTGR